jgi:hypothetical protein
VGAAGNIYIREREITALIPQETVLEEPASLVFKILQMETTCSFEMTVNIYQSSRRRVFMIIAIVTEGHVLLSSTRNVYISFNVLKID